MSEELVEKLAEIEHDQWSHWMKYLFHQKMSIGVKEYFGMMTGRTAVMNEKDYERWCHQMSTPYKDLSEKEKESDRVWARKVVKAIQDFGVDEVFSAEDVTTFIERYG